VLSFLWLSCLIDTDSIDLEEITVCFLVADSTETVASVLWLDLDEAMACLLFFNLAETMGCFFAVDLDVAVDFFCVVGLVMAIEESFFVSGLWCSRSFRVAWLSVNNRSRVFLIVRFGVI